MYPPSDLTHGGSFPQAVDNPPPPCPQVVDKVVDNFIEKRREGSTSGTLRLNESSKLNLSFLICPLD
jgi:hypothetical protein